MDVIQIRRRMLEEGVAQVGFADLHGLLPERYAHLPYGISLIYALSNGVVDEVEEMRRPTYSYFQHYRAVNALLDRQTLWLTAMIEREGCRAIPVAASQSVKDMGDPYTGIFQHKTVAVRAGLGWIGKSALFVSPLYGPRVRLASVLTDMPLKPQPVPELYGKPMSCGGCRECERHCPANAISGEEYLPGISCRGDIFDPAACSEHMKQAYQKIGRGAVCGICMAVCPFGRQKG